MRGMTTPALETPTTPALEPAAAPVAAPAVAPAAAPTAPVAEPELVDTTPVPTLDADADWPDQWLEFGGDRLAVIAPTQGTLQAYIMATSKYSTDDRRVNFTNLFVEKHLSEASYDHVLGRLLDPRDSLYTAESEDETGPFGVLMRAIAALAPGAGQAG